MPTTKSAAHSTCPQCQKETDLQELQDWGTCNKCYEKRINEKNRKALDNFFSRITL